MFGVLLDHVHEDSTQAVRTPLAPFDVVQKMRRG
jgi:hypothetical protein